MKTLDANIKKLETYLIKAKNRRNYVRKSLEDLGISEEVLDDDDPGQNLAIVTFTHEGTEPVSKKSLLKKRGEAVSELNNQEVIEIQPKEGFLSPERLTKKTKDGKPTEKNVPEADEVIIVGSSSEDESGLDFDSGFD